MCKVMSFCVVFVRLPNTKYVGKGQDKHVATARKAKCNNSNIEFIYDFYVTLLLVLCMFVCMYVFMCVLYIETENNFRCERFIKEYKHLLVRRAQLQNYSVFKM